MTDNEIIKALEFCSTKNKCNECAFQPYCSKGEILDEYVLDLINRQKAEIERLQKENEVMKTNYNSMCMSMPNIAKAERAEAIKEFAERLKCNASILCDKVTSLPCSYTISNYNFNRLVKEMVGD